ncbi:MAG: hypothetical protein R3F30_01950 [Planctomycetota bacterium]
MAIASVLVPVLLLAAQTAPSLPEGWPLVQAFYPEDYGGRGNSVWGVALDRRGLLWAVTEAEGLCFDGARWQRFDLGRKVQWFSLALDHDGTPYFGGRGALVTLETGPDGQPRPVDLLLGRRPDDPPFGNVRFLVMAKDALWFSDGVRLGRYVPADGTLAVLSPPEPTAPVGYFNPQASGGEVYCGWFGEGLGVVRGGRVELLPGTEALGKDYPIHVERLPDGRLLVVSHGGALFHHDGERLVRWDCEATRWADHKGITGWARLPDGGFALATMTSGAARFDADGELVQLVDRDAGLPGKAVYGDPVLDDQGGLWLPMQLGLARVSLDDHLQRIGAAGQLRGEIRDLCVVGDRRFVATSEALYEVLPGGEGGRPDTCRLVAELPFETTDLAWDGRYLLLASNQGLMRLDPDDPTVQKVFPVYTTRLAVTRDHVVLGTMVGLFELAYHDRKWSGEPRELLRDRQVVQLEEDRRGRLWVRHQGRDGSQALTCLTLGEDGKVEPVEGAGGPVPGVGVRMFRFRGDLHLCSPDGVRVLDEDALAFVPAGDLPEVIESVAVDTASLHEPTRTVPRELLWLGRDMLWYRDGVDDLQQAWRDSSGVWRRREAVLPFPTTRVAFARFEGDHGWIGTVRGELLLWHEPAALRNPPLAVPRIRWVDVDGDRCLYGGLGAPPAALDPLGPLRSPLHLAWALPSFVRSDRNGYRSRLLGIEDEWTEWSTVAERELSGLAEGDYRLQVLARDAYGRVTETLELGFTILPPWYRSSLAWLARAAVAALAVAGLVHWRVLRERRRVERLEREVRSRKLAGTPCRRAGPATWPWSRRPATWSGRWTGTWSTATPARATPTSSATHPTRSSGAASSTSSCPTTASGSGPSSATRSRPGRRSPGSASRSSTRPASPGASSRAASRSWTAGPRCRASAASTATSPNGTGPRRSGGTWPRACSRPASSSPSGASPAASPTTSTTSSRRSWATPSWPGTSSPTTPRSTPRPAPTSRRSSARATAPAS